MRKRHYLATNCLIFPCESSWTTFYLTGNDINMINITGLDRQSFKKLLFHFSKCFNGKWKIHSNGRPRKLEMHQILGLLLAFYSDTMSLVWMDVLFGVNIIV